MKLVKTTDAKQPTRRKWAEVYVGETVYANSTFQAARVFYTKLENGGAIGYHTGQQPKLYDKLYMTGNQDVPAYVLVGAVLTIAEKTDD